MMTIAEAQLTKVADFLKTGKSNLTTRSGYPMFQDCDCDEFRVVGNKIFLGDQRSDSMPAAILIPSRRKGRKFELMNNADNTDCFVYSPETISMSFICLLRLATETVLPSVEAGSLLGDRQSRRGMKLFFESCKLLDATTDETRKGKKTDPAPTGFTWVDGRWHRPSTVLVLVDTGKRKFHALIGQDDDQYFGVELAGKPKTVTEAYRDLMPPDVQKAKFVYRQGEWFFIPVKKQDFPKEPYAVDDSSKLILPREDEQSNPHWLQYGARLDKDGNMWFYQPYKGTREVVFHDQHQALRVPQGYYRVYRNTAVRSVSVEGVD